MRDFILSVGIGVAAAVAWFGIWIFILRACGLVSFTKTAEARVRVRERTLRMGKGRYILAFGVFGWGLPVGFGTEMSRVAEHMDAGWGNAVASIGLFALWGMAGWWYGLRMWNALHRGEVPFPPPWLSQK